MIKDTDGKSKNNNKFSNSNLDVHWKEFLPTNFFSEQTEM